MPSKSEKQRKAAGAALAAKRSGNYGDLGGASKSMAKGMNVKQLRDFAKRKGGKKNG